MYIEEKRFNWVYAVLDSYRWALTNELSEGNGQDIDTLCALYEYIANSWTSVLCFDSQLRKLIAQKRSKIDVGRLAELRSTILYAYDMELELWGDNYAEYMTWSERPSEAQSLEMFKLVHGFYILERSLCAFLGCLGSTPGESRMRNRNAFENRLYHADSIAKWFPFPFTLAANTRQIVRDKETLLKHFQFRTAPYEYVSKKHYVHVLESSHIRARNWLREKKRKRRAKRAAKDKILSFFFDIFWHYAESYRYQPVVASAYARSHPFFWNLNARWVFSSLQLIIELWLITLFGTRFALIQEDYAKMATAPSFRDILGTRWELVWDRRLYAVV